MVETQEPGSTPEQEQLPLIRARRLGAGASGLLSLLLVGALFAVPFLGLFIAPLGLVPVLHYQAHARKWYLAWSWVAVGRAAVRTSVSSGCWRR